MINHFKDADKTETETQAEDASGVCDEGREGDGLVLLDDGVVRIFEENLQNGKVLFRVLHQEAGEGGQRNCRFRVHIVICVTDNWIKKYSIQNT